MDAPERFRSPCTQMRQKMMNARGGVMKHRLERGCHERTHARMATSGPRDGFRLVVIKYETEAVSECRFLERLRRPRGHLPQTAETRTCGRGKNPTPAPPPPSSPIKEEVWLHSWRRPCSNQSDASRKDR